MKTRFPSLSTTGLTPASVSLRPSHPHPILGRLPILPQRWHEDLWAANLQVSKHPRYPHLLRLAALLGQRHVVAWLFDRSLVAVVHEDEEASVVQQVSALLQSSTG